MDVQTENSLLRQEMQSKEVSLKAYQTPELCTAAYNTLTTQTAMQTVEKTLLTLKK